MTDRTGARVPATFREFVRGRALSPGYVRAATLVADVAAVALQGVGYDPMMPALMPPLPHGTAAGSVPTSQCLQITRIFRRWIERGAALPLRYHLLWPIPTGEQDKLSVDVGAHCALATERDAAVQLAADALALECIAAALRLPFAGGEQLASADRDASVTTVFYLTAPDGAGVPFATCTRSRDGGTHPWVLRAPQSAGQPIPLTSLRIALTMLTDLFLDFNPQLEER